MHGKLDGEHHSRIIIQLNGNPIFLVHKHMMVDVRGENLLKQVRVRLSIWIKFTLSMEKESVVVILREGPNYHKSSNEVNGSISQKLLQARTHVECNS